MAETGDPASGDAVLDLGDAGLDAVTGRGGLLPPGGDLATGDDACSVILTLRGLRA